MNLDAGLGRRTYCRAIWVKHGSLLTASMSSGSMLREHSGPDQTRDLVFENYGTTTAELWPRLTWKGGTGLHAGARQYMELPSWVRWFLSPSPSLSSLPRFPLQPRICSLCRRAGRPLTAERPCRVVLGAVCRSVTVWSLNAFLPASSPLRRRHVRISAGLIRASSKRQIVVVPTPSLGGQHHFCGWT